MAAYAYGNSARAPKTGVGQARQWRQAEGRPAEPIRRTHVDHPDQAARRLASRLGEHHWVESRRTVNDDDLRQWADVRLVTLGRAFDDHLRMYVRQPITRRMNGNRWSQVRAGQGITAP
jgi:hypothetical protein